MTQRIAICFFGITRSLATTLPSIHENVIAPARDLAEVRTFAHLFDVQRVDNVRSGESGEVARDEHLSLGADILLLEPPGSCLERRRFDDIAAHGDFWNDGLKSLSNLVHQLHSLDLATDAALAWSPDAVVFCRPDLRYLDSFGPWLESALADRQDTVYVPGWQHWGGFNDRFAVCSGHAAAQAWGKRVEAALPYVKTRRRALHGERLLAWRLKRSAVRIRQMNVRAVRVRVGGREVRERFAPGWTDVPLEWFWGAARGLRLLRSRSRGGGDGR